MSKIENLFKGIMTKKEFLEALKLYDTIREEFSETLRRKIDAAVQKRIHKDRIKIRKQKDSLLSKYRGYILKDYDFFTESLALQIENAHSVGELFSGKVRKDAKSMDLREYLIDELYAHCVLIANEIYLLISGGFANGAVARWRSLHETSVILQVLKKSEVDISLRYWEHAEMTDFSESLALRQMPARYRKQVSRQKNQLKRKTTRKDQLQTKYGKDFKKQYGWANPLFPNKSPDFSDLEAYVGLGHYHFSYKTASTKIHAGSMGIRRMLHIPPEQNTPVVGPSTYGLYMPTYNTCLTLLQTSAHINMLNPATETLVLMMTMQIVVEALKLYGDENPEP